MNKNKPGCTIKKYELTSKGIKILIHNEEPVRHSAMSSDTEAWQFSIDSTPENKKILAGIQSLFESQMNNWKYKDFYEENGDVARLTTKHLIVFINQSLGDDHIDNLNAKSLSLAQSLAGRFQEKYHA